MNIEVKARLPKPRAIAIVAPIRTTIPRLGVGPSAGAADVSNT